MRNVRVTPDSCFVVEELKAADDSAVSQSSFDSSEEGSPGFFKKHTRLFWISQISKFFIQCPLNISDSVCTKGPSDCGQTADTSVCVRAEPCCTLAARSFWLTMKQTQCTDASMWPMKANETIVEKRLSVPIVILKTLWIPVDSPQNSMKWFTAHRLEELLFTFCKTMSGSRQDVSQLNGAFKEIFLERTLLLMLYFLVIERTQICTEISCTGKREARWEICIAQLWNPLLDMDLFFKKG